MNRFKQLTTEYSNIILGNYPDAIQERAFNNYISLEDHIFAFAKESNEIEGVYSEVMHMEHEDRLHMLLDVDNLTISDLIAFNNNGKLRTNGECVIVGTHCPPVGGQHILYRLSSLLDSINAGELDSYGAHLLFEELHPFTDGNGRTGRAIWAWQQINQEGDNLDNLFLQQWYYDTLEKSHVD